MDLQKKLKELQRQAKQARSSKDYERLAEIIENYSNLKIKELELCEKKRATT